MLFRPSSPFIEEHCIVLGQICISMSNLEWTLQNLLQTILGSDRLAMNLVVGSHLDRTLTVLGAAFYMRDRKESESIAFEKILKCVRKVSEDRNDNIHAKWMFDEKTQKAYRLKIPKHSHGVFSSEKMEVVDILELEKLVNDIDGVTNEIGWFRRINFPFPNEQLSDDAKDELARRTFAQNQLTSPSKEKKRKKNAPKKRNRGKQ